ncbi:hypothetical protein D3C77_574030 [compost metagenome]
MLEGQELEHTQVHRGVETQTALVRADGAAHLYTVAAVDLDLARIIDPRHTEQDRALRLNHTFENAGLKIMRVGLKERPEAAQHFFDCLMEFRLGRVALFQAREEIFDRFDHGDIHQRELDLLVFFRLYQEPLAPEQGDMSFL